MSRFIKDYQVSKSAGEIQNIINNFISKEGFKEYLYKGKNVWKKGVGLAVGPQFMDFQVTDGKVHLEAWAKFAILPGLYAGEMGIEGLIGKIPKNLLKKKIEEFESLLK
ncbi:MAG: hypothetical protein V1720_20585 [bacterium]